MSWTVKDVVPVSAMSWRVAVIKRSARVMARSAAASRAARWALVAIRCRHCVALGCWSTRGPPWGVVDLDPEGDYRDHQNLLLTGRQIDRRGAIADDYF